MFLSSKSRELVGGKWRTKVWKEVKMFVKKSKEEPFKMKSGEQKYGKKSECSPESRKSNLSRRKVANKRLKEGQNVRQKVERGTFQDEKWRTKVWK